MIFHQNFLKKDTLLGIWKFKLISNFLWEQKNTKGQLISKCLFGVFTFFQKANETSRQILESNFFVRYLEETPDWESHFEFVWPL